MSPTNPMRREQVRHDRLQMLANGWTPIRNRDKRTFMLGWPVAVITPQLVETWYRRNGRDLATGARLDNGLCVSDLDIDDNGVVKAIRDRARELIPTLNCPATPWLERTSGKATAAWYFRTHEPFTRIGSRAFVAPEDNDQTGLIEIFGGGSPRQFGTLGPHTVEENGVATRWYQWRDRSPLDTRLGELPVVTRAQMFQLVDAAEAVLRAAGWKPAQRSKREESTDRRVYDLTDDLLFHCNDDVVRTLPELRQQAARDPYLRCSAAWLMGPRATRTDRCLCGLTITGHVYVHETATGVTHIEAQAKPIIIDRNEVHRKLSGALRASLQW